MDREKVIKGLECCSDRTGNKGCYGCPYHEENRNVSAAECSKDVKADALTLLKEQEPIMIKTVMINGSGRNGRCQNCLMMLNEMDYPNYCGNCGQAVKWE